MSDRYILLYSEYNDANGHHHYTVNRYNRFTQTMEYPTDYIF